MTATDELLRIILAMSEKPSVLINASAIGIYPASTKAVYTENSSEIANDFLGRTVHDWEKKAKQAEEYGIRIGFYEIWCSIRERRRRPPSHEFAL